MLPSTDVRKVEGGTGHKRGGHGPCGLEFGDSDFSFVCIKTELSIRSEQLMIHFILHYIKME